MLCNSLLLRYRSFWVLEEYVLSSQSIGIPHQSLNGYLIAEVIEIHEKKRFFHFFSWNYRENWYFCFCKRLRDSRMNVFALREHLPLQQGLRPPICGRMDLNQILREHLPLQQGLRLPRCVVLGIVHSSQRASSFTTRIKTTRPSTSGPEPACSESIFLYNKD